jgi:uncharacterized membrane protein YidH (DUF202 family)
MSPQVFIISGIVIIVYGIFRQRKEGYWSQKLASRGHGYVPPQWVQILIGIGLVVYGVVTLF